MKKNRYPVPDPNKRMINIMKEPSDAHKKTLKEETDENFREKILDVVNQCTRFTEEISRCQK
jgi:hypothetical protein